MEKCLVLGDDPPDREDIFRGVMVPGTCRKDSGFFKREERLYFAEAAGLDVRRWGVKVVMGVMKSGGIGLSEQNTLQTFGRDLHIIYTHLPHLDLHGT